MANLITDPSFEYNIAPTSVGTPTTSERSNTQVHSGSYSWKVITDAIDEGIQLSAVTVSGKFYRLNVWVYVVSGIVTIKNITLHKGSGNQVSSVTGAWQNLQCVFRATAATTNIQIVSNGSITFYVDDIAANILTDVSLTATPASQANSGEGGGIRVDGYDYCRVANTILTATSGKIRLNWIPRHNAADLVKFGNAYSYLAVGYYNASNAFYLRATTANNLNILETIGGATVLNISWNCTGLIVAGTQYLVELQYAGRNYTLYVDGTPVLTGTATADKIFAPATIAFGGSIGGLANIDSVILAP